MGSEHVHAGRFFHRFVSALGAFFFGIGVEAPEREETHRWWERDEVPPPAPRASRLTVQQAELWDTQGRSLVLDEPVVVTGVKAPVAEKPARRQEPKLVLGAGGMVETVVSPVQVKAANAKNVATTKRTTAAVPITAAVKKSAAVTEGGMVRQMVMSQSISFSSGMEEPRRYSVPRRALLPRYQLFAGQDGVVSDRRGGLRIPQRGQPAQKGRVWFV